MVHINSTNARWRYHNYTGGLTRQVQAETHMERNQYFASDRFCRRPAGFEAGWPVSKLANLFYRMNIRHQILYTGSPHVLPFRSHMMSPRFEAYVSAKFPSDGKHGTSGLFHAAFGRKVKVIKHDSYFRLDICRRSICI